MFRAEVLKEEVLWMISQAGGVFGTADEALMSVEDLMESGFLQQSIHTVFHPVKFSGVQLQQFFLHILVCEVIVFSKAVTHHSDVPLVSGEQVVNVVEFVEVFCVSSHNIAAVAGADPHTVAFAVDHPVEMVHRGSQLCCCTLFHRRQ